MKYRVLKKIISILLAAFLFSELIFANCEYHYAHAESGTVNTDRLNLRSGPGTNYSSIMMLSTNMKVEIIESVPGTDGRTWYKISCGNTNGYVRSDYITRSVIYAADDASFETYMNSQGFPESYKNSLRGLHIQHPNWVFLGMQTGLDWNEALKEESRIGLNLVDKNSVSSWKSTEAGGFDWNNNYWPGYDGASWVAASPALIAHYMDPRNFLTDPYIFQFEVQTYDPQSQSKSGLEHMVKGTFLEGEVNTKGNLNNSSSTFGPGFSSPAGSTKSENVPASSTVPGGYSPGDSSTVIGPVVSAPPGAHVSSLMESISSIFGLITAYAGWELTGGEWYYRDSDGSLRKSGWYWIDGNNDGIAESYYFYENGLMARSCSIDGYEVNEDGAWVVNGKVQRKSVSVTGSGTGKKYVDLIMEAAAKSGVSPYVLAAMIIQEQGKNGTSPLISGNYGSYPGFYNFYNINAYQHDGMTAIEAGLKYASETGNGNRPWNTIEKAVIGGACAYGENYTNCGQDTFYLKKFNVQGTNKYKHQFMSNVIAAAQEGAKVASAYNTEIKEGARVFRIPVFQNMPETPCELPSGSGNPNNRLSFLSVEGYSLTPTFDLNTEEYSLIVNDTPSITVSAKAIDPNASVSGTGTYSLGIGLNQIDILVRAENGNSKTYHINITRKSGDFQMNTPQQVQTGPSVSANSASASNSPVSDVRILNSNSTSTNNTGISIGTAPGD